MPKRVQVVLWCLIIAESRSIFGERCHSPRSENYFLETCTRDLMMSSAADFPDVNWSKIQQIREFHIGLPLECQKDFCLNSTTFSTTKGDIAWQPTTIGYRRLNLCPFAHTEEVYAFRDCLLSTNQTIRWTQEDTSVCPLPLFSRAIEKLYNSTNQLKTCTEYECSYILASLSSALRIRRNYPDDPVLSEDHLRTMKMCIDWVTHCSTYYNLSTDVLWNASDLLLEKDFNDFWDEDTGLRFLSYLSWIFRTNGISGQEHDFFNGNNIYVYERMMVGGNFRFRFPVEPDDRITAVVNVKAPEGTICSNIGSFLIKSSRIPDEILSNFRLYETYEPKADQHTIEHEMTPLRFPTEDQTAAYDATDDYSSVDTPKTGFPRYNDSELDNETPSNYTTSSTSSSSSFSSSSSSTGFSSSASLFSLSSDSSSRTDDRQNEPEQPMDISFSSTEVSGQSASQVFRATFDPNTFTIDESDNTTVHYSGPVFEMVLEGYKMVGPLFFIQLQAHDRTAYETKEYRLFGTEISSDESISVEVTFQDPAFSTLTGTAMETIRCGRISSDRGRQSSSPYEKTAPMQYWTADCETVQINAIEVQCRCVSPAFVAVFQHFYTPAKPPEFMSTTSSTVESDLSVFLGFPYVREIYVTGEVLKAISLTCLVITVLAYTICRKARKGTPTRILLNLCVSLIVLIIVLYIAAYEANSEIGCRVLNVLRYYLVLVSLLWNAVEAHNMYRMLVKVFHAETSHFVLIAGIFAWGLPMIAVGIGFAINVGAFDGSYAACTFRCALRPETRLFGWIVPMATIIMHNLIVFAMVVKVIIRTNPLQASGQIHSRSAGQRLCGALTTLVLLGIPWMMSAFGAIDAQENSAEDLLQKACSGILVIFVGLQGLFIFLFHCVRNRTIRDLIRTQFNTSLLLLKGSTSRSDASSLNYFNGIAASTQDVQSGTSSN